MESTLAVQQVRGREGGEMCGVKREGGEMCGVKREGVRCVG